MNKQKKLLCIVDQYYPESSANTQCADIVMQKFVKNGYRVDFMSVKNDYKLPSITVSENNTIYRIETYLVRNLRRFGRIFKVDSWKNFPWLFRKTVGFFNRAIRPFRYNTQSVYLDCINYNDIYKLLKSQNINYDVIVSFSAPFALHVIANKLTKNNFAEKWFPVLLDPFIHNYYLKKRSIKRCKKIAESLFEKTSKIFMVRGIKEENLNKNYNPKYHEKVVEICLPNLVERKIVSHKNNDAKKIILTYAGMFYEDIRNPEKMLDILAKLPDNMQINLIGDGCEKIIKNKIKLFTNNLNILHKIPYSECIQNLSNSNILINLGNTITNQTPSKVFEYISFGKPIVNFYFSEKDTSLYYLKKYSLAININLNDYTENDVVALKNFCESNYKKQLSFSESVKYLEECLSENVCNKIYYEIDKSLKPILPDKKLKK